MNGFRSRAQSLVCEMDCFEEGGQESIFEMMREEFLSEFGLGTENL